MAVVAAAALSFLPATAAHGTPADHSDAFGNGPTRAPFAASLATTHAARSASGRSERSSSAGEPSTARVTTSRTAAQTSGPSPQAATTAPAANALPASAPTPTTDAPATTATPPADAVAVADAVAPSEPTTVTGPDPSQPDLATLLATLFGLPNAMPLPQPVANVHDSSSSPQTPDAASANCDHLPTGNTGSTAELTASIATTPADVVATSTDDAKSPVKADEKTSVDDGLTAGDPALIPLVRQLLDVIATVTAPAAPAAPAATAAAAFAQAFTGTTGVPTAVDTSLLPLAGGKNGHAAKRADPDAVTPAEVADLRQPPALAAAAPTAAPVDATNAPTAALTDMTSAPAQPQPATAPLPRPLSERNPAAVDEPKLNNITDLNAANNATPVPPSGSALPAAAPVVTVAAEPARGAPNPLERAVGNQVGRALLRVDGSGDRTLVLRLTPPELGTVRIEVRQQGGVLSAQLHAEDAGVQQALDRLLPQIRSELQRADALVRDVNVGPERATVKPSEAGQQSRDQQPDQGDAPARQTYGEQQSQQQQQQRREARLERQRARSPERFTLDAAASTAPTSAPALPATRLGGRADARGVDARA